MWTTCGKSRENPGNTGREYDDEHLIKKTELSDKTYYLFMEWNLSKAQNQN